MGIRQPVDSSQNVQAAFRDVEQEIEDLKAAVAAMAGGTDLTAVNERIDRIPPPVQLDSDKFTFVGSGPQHSVGLVPDPGGTADNEAVLLETGSFGYPIRGLVRAVSSLGSVGGVQDGADVVDVHAALHVAGPISAHTGIFKEVQTHDVSSIVNRTPAEVCEMYDDFVSGLSATNGSIGALGWSAASSGGGASTNNTTGTSGHPGIQLIATGTTNNSIAALFHHADFYPFQLGDITRMQANVRVSAKQGTFRFGSSSSVVVELANGAVAIENVGGEANWFAVTSDGSSTRTDTGVACTAAVWFLFDIVRTDKQTWQFYINGNLVATHTGAAQNVPADTVAVQVIPQTKSNGTSANFLFDFIRVFCLAKRTL